MEEKDSKRLYARLKEYADSDIYPFHMPGHKRQYWPEETGGVYRMDITEIEGFDDLHDAKGILAKAQQFAARLYQSEETFFSVNGSTGAILAAIGTVCGSGDRILIARNCHKSVYHAIELNQLEVSYIYPQTNTKYAVNEGIYPQHMDKKWIKQENIQAIVITSPTYDGVVSDIRGICACAHAAGVPVIVDEAHGAHFPFSPYFPDSALHCGADIVIQSTHKTLPALTQTAILHVNGNLVDRERLRRMLTVYQTSSPSYLLMGSIDDCMHWLEAQGERQFALYSARLASLRAALSGCRMIHLLERGDLDPALSYDYDRSKLVLSAGPGSGSWLYRQFLAIYGLQMEMKTADYVLAMTSVCDSREGFDRLLAAALDLDKRILAGEAPFAAGRKAFAGHARPLPRPESVYRAGEAVRMHKEWSPLAGSEGRIAGEYVYLYPPGIPLLVPGERIGQDALEQILYWTENGMEASGVYYGKTEDAGQKNLCLRVIRQNET